MMKMTYNQRKVGISKNNVYALFFAGNNLNIARGRPTMQSSLYPGGAASRAVDGNNNALWQQGSCMHTKKDVNPWMAIDLGKSTTVGSVSVTNRKDSGKKFILH
jgi:hypothetical protein